MSFTEDELQSFNMILEQRLLAHRKEMERAFDQRISEYRRDSEQRFVAMNQDMLRNMTLKLAEFQGRIDTALSEKLNTQQTRITQAINHDVEQRTQQVESSVDRMLAAQLLGIEQLLSQQLQQLSLQPLDETAMTTGGHPQLEAIEVQTELQWEDLLEVLGKALDERLAVLNEAMQHSLKNLEQYLAMRLHSLRDEFVRSQPQSSTLNGSATTIQEVLHGIEHLERIIESMQVAMTANHALLSNRLYHHQQLPLERAHPGGQTRFAPGNGMANALSIAKERIAKGLEPGVTGKTEVEEQKGL